MPFVLNGREGSVSIEARGIRHDLAFAIDQVRQAPVITHEREASDVSTGTVVRLDWPDSPRSMRADEVDRFLQIAADFAWLNPHLTIRIDWFGEVAEIAATEPAWSKWKPSDPTSAHWYDAPRLERLIGAYVAHDSDAGRQRMVREFVGEERSRETTGIMRKLLLAARLSRVCITLECFLHRVHGQTRYHDGKPPRRRHRTPMVPDAEGRQDRHP